MHVYVKLSRLIVVINMYIFLCYLDLFVRTGTISVRLKPHVYFIVCAPLLLQHNLVCKPVKVYKVLKSLARVLLSATTQKLGCGLCTQT